VLVQPGKCLCRKAGVQLTLDIRDDDSRMPGDQLAAYKPLFQRRHVAFRFERILRADQPPDVIEAEQLQRQQADVAVAVMGRVEGAAEQADLLAGPELTAVEMDPLHADVMLRDALTDRVMDEPDRSRAPDTCNW
jgi:hypothetical protein